FPAEVISELAASMKEVGQNTPVLVRPANGSSDAETSEPSFELVCGEGRLRAAKQLGWTTLWTVVEEMTDEEAGLRGMVDNEQRRSLNPLERAIGYQRLINEYHLSQQQVAKRSGIAGSTLSRLLCLLDEPTEIQELLKSGALTEFHCRTLDRIVDRKKRVRLAKEVAEREMSAKQTSDRVDKILSRRAKEPGSKKKLAAADLAADYGGFRFWWEGENIGMRMRTFRRAHDSLEQYTTNFKLALKGFLENEPCPVAAPPVDPQVAALMAASSAAPPGAVGPTASSVSASDPGPAVATPVPEPS